MTDIPAPITDALSGILHKLIPEKTHIYIFAFIPGVFLEISMLIANPARIHCMIATVGHSTALKIAVALFLAFVIGNAFMFLAALVQRVFGALRRRSGSDAKNATAPDTALEANKIWARIAGSLLQRRYGIDSHALSQGEWNALYLTLAPPEEEPNILMTASEAIGWSGLAAILVEPGLRSAYYIVFVAFMISMGILYDWHVAGKRKDSRFQGIMKVRALLKESQCSSPTPKRPSQDGPASS